MKEIERKGIRPIYIEAGDSLTLTYDETITSPSGITETIGTEVLKAEIDRAMVVDEVVIFYVDKGDFKGAKDGIGGAFLVSDKETPCK